MIILLVLRKLRCGSKHKKNLPVLNVDRTKQELREHTLGCVTMRGMSNT
jgi:hypothetical protein